MTVASLAPAHPVSISAGRRPRRWVSWAAHAAALTALPSGLWRIIVALGGPSGYTPAGLLEICPPGIAGPAYLLTLSVLTELAAVATLALVRPWGERVPRWVPVLGGRSVPYRPVVAVAGVGVAVLAALWTPMLFWWLLPHPGMTEMGRLLVGLLYQPLAAWAPLLAVVTVDYWRRRRHG
jgi:hypothetical protein